VGNSPTNYTDPTGNIAFIPFLIGVGKVATATTVVTVVADGISPDGVQAPTIDCGLVPNLDKSGERAVWEFVLSAGGSGLKSLPSFLKGASGFLDDAAKGTDDLFRGLSPTLAPEAVLVDDYWRFFPQGLPKVSTTFDDIGFYPNATGAGSSLSEPLEDLFQPYFESSTGSKPEFEGSEYSSPIDPKYPGRPDPQKSIDTSTFPSGTPTANGGIRDNKQFWKEWEKLNPDTLSSSNRYRIDELGLSPTVDKQWINHYPEHAKYKGEKLIHHHVDQGSHAIPVPQSTHIGSGGPFHHK
jgi:hypothetical protein